MLSYSWNNTLDLQKNLLQKALSKRKWSNSVALSRTGTSAYIRIKLGGLIFTVLKVLFWYNSFCIPEHLENSPEYKFQG